MSGWRLRIRGLLIESYFPRQNDCRHRSGLNRKTAILDAIAIAFGPYIASINNAILLSHQVTLLSHQVTLLSHQVTLLSHQVTLLGNQVTLLGNQVTLLSHQVTLLSN